MIYISNRLYLIMTQLVVFVQAQKVKKYQIMLSNVHCACFSQMELLELLWETDVFGAQQMNIRDLKKAGFFLLFLRHYCSSFLLHTILQRG